MANYQRMTRAEFDDLVRRFGRDKVQQIMLANQTVIVPDELPPSNPAQLPVASGGAAGGLPGPSMTANTPAPAMSGSIGGNIQTPLEKLTDELLALPGKREELRNALLQKGRDYINQTYRGPSTSDRLWALSKAFLAPRPYRGFAGTMYNLTQSLSGLAEERKTAEEKRQEALFKLQQQYRTGQFEDESEALKLRYQVAKEQADAEREAAKDRRPKIVPVTGGGFVVQPGTGGLPDMPEVNSRGQYVITDIRQIAFLPRGSKMVRADDPTQKEAIAPGPTQ